MELSLDPVQKPQSNKDATLSEQITRITQERGPFSDITEANLEKEIEESTGTPPQEEDASVEELQAFEQQRTLLSTKIRSALNESQLSLDFVSLLVSCLRPQSGASSMSPMLKGQVPIGTLSGDTISPQSVAPTLSETRGVPGYGWKLMALDDAADKLGGALERLELEANKEEKFWQDIWVAMKQGEKISKQKRNLRVKYGYRDSGSKYFKTGLGSINRAEDGGIDFAPDMKSSGKVVCVTVHRNDEIDGRAFSVCDSPESPIKVARHHLFEDELFYYLLQEARTLAEHRVTLADNSIVCQLYEYVVEISCVDISSLKEEENKGVLANVICNCIHLLLNQRHAENLATSHSIPPALNSKKPLVTSQLPLLKPVLAHIQQSTAELRVKKLVEMMIQDAHLEPVQLPDQPDPSRPLDLLLECPPRVYRVNDIKITINSPFGEAELYEAEANGKHSRFHDLAELELWLKGETSSDTSV